MQEKVGQLDKQLGVVKEDVVKRKRQLEDYDLGTTASNPIALYDPEVVREFLNDRDYTKGFKHLLLKRSTKGLQNSLFYNTAAILSAYFVFWMIVHVFYVHNLHKCTAPTLVLSILVHPLNNPILLSKARDALLLTTLTKTLTSSSNQQTMPMQIF